MMFGMFEFTSVAGVSPTPATDRARMEALVATLPSDSSFLIDLPLGKEPMPVVLHVPRTGEGALYTQTMGMILPQPVAKLEWQGDSFQFNTLLRTLGPGGGFYAVTGTVGAGGTVRGTLQRLGNRAQTPPPPIDYTGAHSSVRVHRRIVAVGADHCAAPGRTRGSAPTTPILQRALSLHTSCPKRSSQTKLGP